MSKPAMKIFGYVLLLPLVHLVIAAPPIIYQESQVWRFVPAAQAAEDFELTHPAPNHSADATMAWDICYEYRMSTAGRVISTVDLPTALLIGSSAYECAQGAIRPIIKKLKYHGRVRERTILIECLIVLGIFVQWGLIGRWLDSRRQQSKPLRRWIIPVSFISVGGLAMIPTAFGRGEVAELINLCLGMTVLFAWLILLLMYAGAATGWMVKRLRSRAPQVVDSRF